MSWYKVPVDVSSALFIVILVTAVMDIIIALESGEYVRDKQAKRFFIIYYMILAGLSLLSLAEALLAIVSVEGGIYLALWALPRYLFVLPTLIYVVSHAVCHAAEEKLPRLMKPIRATYFIPLLRLPPLEMLPMPAPIIITVFAVLWLLSDAVLMMAAIIAHARSDITRDILRRIIRGMDRGICVMDSRGCILETNPAFRGICGVLGLTVPETAGELHVQLRCLHESGSVILTEMENGRSIRKSEKVFLLRSDTFLFKKSFFLRKKTYTQLSVSDITQLYRTTIELEKEKNRLNTKNEELREAMERIMLETAIMEREKLCRSAHDAWSQKLAVAGLSLDMLLLRQESTDSVAALAEISRLLEPSYTPELFEAAGEKTKESGAAVCGEAGIKKGKREAVTCGDAGIEADILEEAASREAGNEPVLNGDAARAAADGKEGGGAAENGVQDLLRTLSGIYRKLGVEIEISGHAEFTRRQHEVLGSVIKEGLANAVRHAYARQIRVAFHEDMDTTGMLMVNRCMDDAVFVAEGRGLHDIRARLREAGGEFSYQKSEEFSLEVRFEKNCLLQSGI